MRRAIRSAVAVAAALVTAVAGYAAADAQHADAATPLGPGLVTVTVTIHYSHFSLSSLHVRRGTTVRFLILDADPIDHEFIVGDAQVQALHEHGSEAVHPPVPGEVSVRPGEEGETFYRFDRPGLVLFACHLPGHFAYGMHGWIDVT